jgi:ABC-2 type transport system permease protein
VRATATIERPTFSARLAYVIRVLRVIAATNFKLKYADSALGYVWSLLKPLALFSILYVIFGRFFKLEVGFENFPLYLLLGLVLWNLFADGTSLAMHSVVESSSMLRKLSFPRELVPLAALSTVFVTFAVNIVAIAVFVAAVGIGPQLSWLLLPLLILELLVFTVGVSLFLAAMRVRFHDIAQLWDLAVQMLFYASAIFYPVGFLPPWAQPIAFLSPFVQVMQDVRRIIIDSPQVTTAADVYGTSLGRLLAVGVAFLTLGIGYALFRHDSPYFAERV